MKIRLIFMIIFSVCMGIPTDIATFTLYGSEFSSVFEMINAGIFRPIELVIWIMLLITHLGMVALLFLTRKKYFKILLIIVPLLFVIFYALLEGVFILFLLVPFLIMWLVCLGKLRDLRIQD